MAFTQHTNNSEEEQLSKHDDSFSFLVYFQTCGKLLTAAIKSGQLALLFDYQAFVYMRLSETVTKKMYETAGKDFLFPLG